MNSIAETRPIGRSATAGASRRSAWTWAYRLLHTEERVSPALLRVVLGAVIFPHGAQHLLGWFGGYGFAGTHQWMTGEVGIPPTLATVAILTEFFAPLALVLGLGGRVAAVGVGVLMAVAATTHLEHGFFMNWNATLPAGAEGFEFHLLAMALASAVAIQGSGALSLDRAITADGSRISPARAP